MDALNRKAKLVGGLIITGMATGIFSVAPAIDSPGYLTEAAANVNQSVIGALFQIAMASIYLVIAVILYPILKPLGESLALGFLGLRGIAAVLVVFGAILLSSILALSQEFAKDPTQNAFLFEALGMVLKATRDNVNHGYMIVMLCLGNTFMYVLFLKSELLPKLLSITGLAGAALSALASGLVLFQVVEVISVEYLALNAPTALLEIILALWLIVKGFNPARRT